MILKNDDIEQAFKNIEVYLDSSVSIITNIYQAECYNDYPLFYQYVTDYTPRQGRYNADLLANGISLNKKEAVVKAVMETIERWYLSDYSEKELLFDSFDNIKKKVKYPIDPKIFLLTSGKQLLQKQYKQFRWDESTPFYWTKVNSLHDKSESFIPAQLIHFMYKKSYTEPTIRLSDSTGAAAGISTDQALYNAVCELIERDAYAITYYNRLPIKKIRTDQINDNTIKNLITYISRHYFTVLLFDIRLDIDIPIFLCLLIDETNVGPKISIGVKCSLSWQDAMSGAIMEALQGINATRTIIALQQSLKKNEFKKFGLGMQAILERVMYWANPISVDDISFLLSSSYESFKPPMQKEVILGSSFSNLLSVVIRKLEKVGINKIYWKQITPSYLNKYNITSVKVVIPNLQTIPLDGSLFYFGGDRLYNVPVRCGFQKNPTQEKDFNRIPHPLP